MAVTDDRPVVVTGASGFVGGALVRRLQREGVPVRAVVRTHGRGGPEALVGPALGPEADWSRLLAGAGAVVHAAAHVHVEAADTGAARLAFRRANVEGTRSLAQQAADAGVRRFVFISSIGVNGRRTKHPFTEDDAPAPEGPYADSKLEAERALCEVAQRAGMEWVVIRPPLVYGPAAPGNFARLVRWVARGVPLPLGAVRNRRTLVAIDNLTDLVLTCLRSDSAANEVFLAGDAESLSTPDLLRIVAKAQGRTARLVPVPPVLLRAAAVLIGRLADAERLCGDLEVDIGKACRVLHWTPPLSAREALRRAVTETAP
ncbi:MAG: NAD-dependent epimerase/dehydratase family protein [Methyloversatilis discipulorum]|uniref:NAD-dependent epimerase/dehydratase family protein n=1 Tax=Methyloversatilis discipulorum TaxID=1119528 RepID=UPI0026F315E7|nr:NAD-dependent epimerase/dehydratase family protein [Methyloversatilis discipulorum]MBV5287123.1 NAD-dependent epimerase/dehydratase family protein [Methyloversatilis discipulorum]